MLRPDRMTAAADVAKNVFEWVFRPAALREARAGLESGEAHAAIQQAKLLLEVGRRVEETTDALPPGARPAVTLGLYRDAIYWALAARRAGAGAPPADLREVWDASAAETLAASGPDRQTADALRRALVDDYDPRSLAVTGADAARAREFAQALLWEAEAPRRRANWVHAQRWLRVGGIVLAVLLLVGGVRSLLQGRDLASGKPFRISKEWAGWTDCLENEDCKNLKFHTDVDTNPWVEIDLGAPQTVRRVDISNRDKCCQDRAVPLIIELSSDQKAWTQVARRDQQFSTWTAKFKPTTARYVRLKVLKPSMFHLRSVAVR
jgi:hypothetical protein